MRAIILGLSLFSLSIHAQKTPEWTWEAESKVLWQQITPLGNLLVDTKDALIGIDQETGQKMWEIPELGKLPSDSYGVLPTTFFVEITRGNEVTGKNRVTVVDAWEGKIIFDSKQAGYKTVLSKNILYRGGGILIYGFQEGLQATMSCYDISTGKELWTNADIFSKGKKKSGFGKFMQAAQISSDQSEQGGRAFEIIETNASSFIVATVNGLFRIETQTGNSIWFVDLPQPKGAISSSMEYQLIQVPSGPDFYFAKSNFIQAMNIETGKEVWPQPLKISGIVDRIISHEKGLITLPKIDPKNNFSAPKANLVNYQTGETYWGKKGKGTGIRYGSRSHRSLSTI